MTIHYSTVILEYLDKIINNKIQGKVIRGNIFKLIRFLPENSIDCIITSPPYYFQRNYGDGFEIWFDYLLEKPCLHQNITIIPARRKHTSGDQPSINSKININRGNNVNRPGKDSLICNDCGCWKGDFGLEPWPELYIQHVLDLTLELLRVLKPTGTFFLNMGDKRNNSGGAGNQYSKYRKTHIQFGKMVGGKGQSLPLNIKDLPRSTLLCIPKIISSLMVWNQGWIDKNDLIWRKLVCMPHPTKIRFITDYEPVYFFTKTNDYFFKRLVVPKKYPKIKGGHQFGGKKSTELKENLCNSTYSGNEYISSEPVKTKRTTWLINEEEAIVDLEYLRFLENQVYGIEKFQNRGSVWQINTAKFTGQHIAVMPIKLASDLIKTGCPKNGIVLDPFGGSGTTGIAAYNLNRKYLLFEMIPDYVKISEERIPAKQFTDLMDYYNKKEERELKPNKELTEFINGVN